MPRGNGAAGHAQRNRFMNRILSTLAVLALMSAPAFATDQHNSAPTTQSAMSTARAKFGSASALSLNNNAIDQSNIKIGKGFVPGQSNDAPTTQSATSHAFAKRGDASATSVNTNEILQSNGALGRKSPFKSNSAPTTQSARSHAVSIGGDANALSANSNAVSQSNDREEPSPDRLIAGRPRRHPRPFCFWRDRFCFLCELRLRCSRRRRNRRKNVKKNL